MYRPSHSLFSFQQFSLSVLVLYHRAGILYLLQVKYDDGVLVFQLCIIVLLLLLRFVQKEMHEKLWIHKKIKYSVTVQKLTKKAHALLDQAYLSFPLPLERVGVVAALMDGLLSILGIYLAKSCGIFRQFFHCYIIGGMQAWKEYF